MRTATKSLHRSPSPRAYACRQETATPSSDLSVAYTAQQHCMQEAFQHSKEKLHKVPGIHVRQPSVTFFWRRVGEANILALDSFQGLSERVMSATLKIY